MGLGDKLKRLRLEHGLTMEEMANRLNQYDLNVGKSMISRWESEKTVPLNTYLTGYAKYFKVTMDYLLDLNIENPENPEFPTQFTTPEEAMNFLLNQQVVMGFNGLDITKLPKNDQVEYANEVLNMMKLVSLKYKDKKWNG